MYWALILIVTNLLLARLALAEILDIYLPDLVTFPDGLDKIPIFLPVDGLPAEVHGYL